MKVKILGHDLLKYTAQRGMDGCHSQSVGKHFCPHNGKLEHYHSNASGRYCDYKMKNSKGNRVLYVQYGKDFYGCSAQGFQEAKDAGWDEKFDNSQTIEVTSKDGQRNCVEVDTWKEYLEALFKDMFYSCPAAWKCCEVVVNATEKQPLTAAELQQIGLSHGIKDGSMRNFLSFSSKYGKRVLSHRENLWGIPTTVRKVFREVQSRIYTELFKEMQSSCPATWECFLLEHSDNCNKPAKVSELEELAKRSPRSIPTGTVRGTFTLSKKNRFACLLEHDPEAATWHVHPDAEVPLEKAKEKAEEAVVAKAVQTVFQAPNREAESQRKRIVFGTETPQAERLAVLKFIQQGNPLRPLVEIWSPDGQTLEAVEG